MVKRVLVISDAWPPGGDGGAERSLATTLAELIHLEEAPTLKIVVLDSRQSNIERQCWHDHELVFIPRAAHWPPQSAWPPGTRERGYLPAQRLLRAACWGARYLARPGRIQQKLRRLSHYRSHRDRHPERAWLAYDDDRVLHGPTLTMLAREVDRFRPDLIHADNCWSMLHCAVVGREYQGQMIGFVRDHRFACANEGLCFRSHDRSCNGCRLDCLEGGWQTDILYANHCFRRWALAQFDRVLVASESMAQQLRLFTATDATALDNPVEYIDTPTTANNDATLLCPGTLHPNKGQDVLLHAMPDILHQRPDARLILAGQDGFLRRQLQSLTEKLGISPAVDFRGWCDGATMDALYRRATLVVMPARWPEPFGRVVIEAAMHERAVVATAVGAYPDLIEHEHTGLLVPPDNSKALAAACCELLEDRGKRSRLGQEARRRACKRFDARQTAERLLKLWCS